MSFELHPNFENKLFITDLPLCRILLEDEKHYPWLLVIPRRPNISRIMDLIETDQLQLIKDLDVVQKVMWAEFKPVQLNVAAIGNKTPQLHIHVIARYKDDPAWPNTVWDHPIRCEYVENDKNLVLKKLKQKLDT